jgi:methyl-accepting chemotaxis protein
MFKFASIFGSASEPQTERITVTELCELRGQVIAIGRSQAVIEFALDGTILAANENFLRTVGYRLEQIRGQHHRMFVEPGERETHTYRAFWDHLGRGEYHSGQYKRVGANGREIWLQASYNPILDSAGKPMKVVKYCTDITVDKTRSADAEGQIRAIDKAQAVIEFDIDGTIRTANDNFLRVVGYSLDEVRGRHHRMFVEPATAESAEYREFWHKLGRGEYDAGLYKRAAKGGREVWLQASYNPIFDASGRVTKVVKYASDVSEQKRLTTQLAAMVKQIQTASSEVQTSAQEIANGNASLSQRVSQQAASLEETAASMEEMTTTVKQNAESARHANDIAIVAREHAEQGGKAVTAAVTAMQTISDSSKKIADIIGVIDEIAFQTNLLALNAAVEAARAGDQGRGFAVVASEVRSLAGRSAAAAKEIKALIEDSVHKVADGSELVARSGATLTDIINSVKKVTHIVAEIAGASAEQQTGIEQVGRVIIQMDESTQQNAALVEEVAAASKAIVDQVRALNAATNMAPGNATHVAPDSRKHSRSAAPQHFSERENAAA